MMTQNRHKLFSAVFVMQPIHDMNLDFYQASDLGIEMNECRIYEKDGLHHFMIKCFDRVNGRKIHMQTLHIILITDGYQSTRYL